jgi:hypothetical protein
LLVTAPARSRPHALVERPYINHKRSKVMGIKDRESGSDAAKQKGGIGYVLLWFLGVPIPVLIIIALLRGCA